MYFCQMGWLGWIIFTLKFLDEKQRRPQTFAPSQLLATPPKQRANKSVREYFGKDEAVYIMDAKHTGNIGRFLNVSILHCNFRCIAIYIKHFFFFVARTNIPSLFFIHTNRHVNIHKSNFHKVHHFNQKYSRALALRRFIFPSSTRVNQTSLSRMSLLTLMT